MNNLQINQFQKAQADLSLLGLKHTSDKVVNTATANPLSNLERQAREHQVANAHDALNDLVQGYQEEVAEEIEEEALEDVQVQVLSEPGDLTHELEIRVGGKTITILID